MEVDLAQVLCELGLLGHQAWPDADRVHAAVARYHLGTLEHDALRSLGKRVLSVGQAVLRQADGQV